MKKMVYIAIPIIFIIIVSASFSRDVIITGQVKTEPGKSLKGVLLSLTLFGVDNPGYEQTIQLEEDGSFELAGKYKAGKYVLTLNLISYPEGLWREPFFSHEMQLFSALLEKGKTHHIDHLYILEPVEVVSPKENEVFTSPNDIVFKWDSIPYANYYNLFIDKIGGHEDDQDFIITVFIDDTKIAYENISSLELVRGELSKEDLYDIQPFNRRFRELESGTYNFFITAGIVIPEKKEEITLGETSRIKEYIFYIE